MYLTAILSNNITHVETSTVYFNSVVFFPIHRMRGFEFVSLILLHSADEVYVDVLISEYIQLIHGCRHTKDLK